MAAPSGPPLPGARFATTRAVRSECRAASATLRIVKSADEALRESERRFRGLLENVQLPAAMFDLQGNYVFVNDYTLAITGWTREEMLGHSAAQFMPPEQQERVRQALGTLTRPGAPTQWFSEPAILTRDGKLRLLQVNNLVLRDPGGAITAIASLGADVTEHRALQEQYLQSQKLESLGTLAGGVAHDFNNLLTVINGYSNLVLRSLDLSDPVRPQIDQIHRAGRRAAELTQQLLTFSRKQITQPQAVDLNDLLEESGAMFRSLLGEDIELTMDLSRPLGRVTTDPGQMHQVLMNLVANARDAMPDGGKVTIRTQNITVSADFQTEHPEVVPGPCVVLVVSDTGVGMDEQTRAHLFEPFFTTKGLGKGTGLGLSTVYADLVEAERRLDLGAQRGQATERRSESICPASIRANPKSNPPAQEDQRPAGEPANSELILVVEDQEQVRGLTTLVLESLGYRVMSVADGPAAIALSGSYDGQIDLLLTDVVLPGMNGKQLAEHLTLLRPGMAVLFTSGYSGEVVAHRGVLDRDVAYIAETIFARGFGGQASGKCSITNRSDMSLSFVDTRRGAGLRPSRRASAQERPISNRRQLTRLPHISNFLQLCSSGRALLQFSEDSIQLMAALLRFRRYTAGGFQMVFSLFE